MQVNVLNSVIKIILKIPGICLGPVRYLGADACLLSMLVFMLMLGYSVVSLLICFIYRYALIAPEWIGRLLSKNITMLAIFAFSKLQF
jgi:hypothetical protein